MTALNLEEDGKYWQHGRVHGMMVPNMVAGMIADIVADMLADMVWCGGNVVSSAPYIPKVTGWNPTPAAS